MEAPFAPKLVVGDLAFLGSYWFQITQSVEARLIMEPSENSIVIRLEDFSGEGTPDAKVELRAKNEMVLSLCRVKRAPEFGTAAPQRLGDIGELEIWFSFIVRPTQDAAQVSLVLYTRGKAQPGDHGKGSEQANA